MCTYIIVQIPVTKYIYFAGWIVVYKGKTSYEHVPPHEIRELQENGIMSNLLVGLVYCYGLVHLPVQCKWIQP